MARKKKSKIEFSSSDDPLNDAFAGLNLGGLELPAAPSSVEKKTLVKVERKVYGGRLDVKREKTGRGGKTVTVIYGVTPMDKKEAKNLLLSLKKKFATGGTQHTERLELQGDVLETLVDHLRTLGYKAVRSGG